MLDDHAFAVCLTHDVDRPYKTYQAPYYALVNRDPSQLRSLLSRGRPYWQFEEIMALEDDLGVRSTFFFLNEQNLFRDKSPREWLRPANWKHFVGRYEITDPAIADVIRELDAGGWEVGLHGSYESPDDPVRLREEKSQLERILGHEITGGRQHYLRLTRPDTWEIHRELGLRYDASLGSTDEVGFRHGYGLLRPFDDEFAVFPLTAMEVALLGPETDLESARERGYELLREAERNDAVATLLWHPRFFNEDEFGGYRQLYVDLVEYAQERNAWVGSCTEFLRRVDESNELERKPVRERP
ncbi:polysaccharide deacetylase family protein [Saliphagus sp. GCM10025308]